MTIRVRARVAHLGAQRRRGVAYDTETTSVIRQVASGRRRQAAENSSDLMPSARLHGVEPSHCGIAAEHLPNVFERFCRADPSRARATGLGLALVKQFVTAHGGTVDVATTPGSGSRFSFTLPVAHACAALA